MTLAFCSSRVGCSNLASKELMNYGFFNNKRALILQQSFVRQVPNFQFLPIWPPPLPIWRLLPCRSIGVPWGSLPFPLPVDQTHARRGYYQFRLPEGARHTNSTMETSKFNTNTHQPRSSNNRERENDNSNSPSISNFGNIPFSASILKSQNVP